MEYVSSIYFYTSEAPHMLVLYNTCITLYVHTSLNGQMDVGVFIIEQPLKAQNSFLQKLLCLSRMISCFGHMQSKCMCQRLDGSEYRCALWMVFMFLYFDFYESSFQLLSLSFK